MSDRKIEMEKQFDPSSFESRWQEFWRKRDLFEATSGERVGESEPWSIMIPPPNVTGKLHMGHALQSTLQDLLVRWRRMQGRNALWLPGTDHAGIATQLMVERQLATEGTSRQALGREEFERRVWEWKELYQSNIRDQLEIMGASCDWSRERFTLDEGMSKAVREAFVRLWEEGLVTRGEYMVNWSPVLQTAISDLEVEARTVEGQLYHLAYPVEDSDERLVVATTRPETMLGDMAVAMHPEDERYQHLRGKTVRLPIVGRLIPIIEDSYVDPEFGTGLVKITPWHDPNDFEMAGRHDLEGIRVIGFDGCMTAEAGADFEGLDRFEARTKVLERLEAADLLVKVEGHSHAVGHSQRGGEPVEPMVSMQWFVDVSEMAKRSLEVVDSGELELIPASWNKTWAHWLENIRPWVVSRQLWWGHRIPAWYDRDGNCFVARSRGEAEAAAGTTDLEQDPDVLDTWFSSGLWPMSTLGWPEESDDLRTFFPTDVLVTGFDILFFWVARMVMMSLHFKDEVPFSKVHLTGLVRDENGEKMSKTKGNVVDPRDLIDEYGADAVRFTLAILDVPGRDIPLDPERVAGYRAFGNKIWNATRFALSRIDATVHEEIDAAGLAAPERWILSRLGRTEVEVTEQLEAFRFDEACNRLYHFFWHELCDWYIELTKPALGGGSPRPLVGETLLLVLDRSLRLLHPVMPHLTEEVWHRLPGIESIAPESLALAQWPTDGDRWHDPEAEAEIVALIGVISHLRTLRKERGLKSSVPIDVVLEGGDIVATKAVLDHRTLVGFLARTRSVNSGTAPPDASRDLVAGVELAAVFEAPEQSQVDRERLEKELAKIDGEIAGARKRLANPKFVEQAPAKVVEGNRARLAELEERRSRLAADLAT